MLKEFNKCICEIQQGVTHIGNAERVILFIDGENVSYRKMGRVMSKAREFGYLCCATVYDNPLHKEEWVNWRRSAKKHGLLLMPVQGKQRQDMVDNIIKKDIYNMLAHFCDDFDVLCLASGDGGYYDVLKKARNKGKRVIVVHTSRASKKLREVSDKVLKV